jgi:hypothetical protein
MLYASFYTICLVFRYTSWHFYAFSGTNLLTRCHSVTSLFSVVFVFQKSYTGNIIGIGQNQSSRPDISRSFQNTEEEMEPDQRVATPLGGAAHPWPVPAYGVGPLVHFSRRLFAYKDPSTGKT